MNMRKAILSATSIAVEPSSLKKTREAHPAPTVPSRRPARETAGCATEEVRHEQAVGWLKLHPAM